MQNRSLLPVRLVALSAALAAAQPVFASFSPAAESLAGLSVMLLGASSATATEATASFAGPALEISKTCPGLRYLGREARFEISVTNRGDATATNVVVTDVLTGGFAFVGADNDGRREGDRVVWRLGDLPAGETRTMSVTVLCNQIGVVKNRATVTYCAEAVDECETEVKGIPAVLLECVDDPDPIELNGTLTYVIKVTNQGTAIGTNIVIECTLPPEEQYVEADGPARHTAEGAMVKFEPLPSLAPRATATYKVRVKGVGTGDVRFGVRMTTDQTTSPVMETESTHIYD